MKTCKKCTFKSIGKDSETISGIDNPSNSKYVECSFAENAGLDVWHGLDVEIFPTKSRL